MLWADKNPAAPFPLHLRLPSHKEEGAVEKMVVLWGVCVCVRMGGWNERGKEAEEEGEEIKYFMMGWCKKKKLKKEEINEVDGSGVCVGEGG